MCFSLPVIIGTQLTNSTHMLHHALHQVKRENLENAMELVEEFEREYGRDDRDVRWQEKTENNKDYWRGGFPGWYATRRLFGWSDGEYDKRYWQRLEKNWKRWKRVEPVRRREGRLIAICEVREEEGGKIEEWNEEDEMGCMGDLTGELWRKQKSSRMRNLERGVVS